MLKKIGWNYGSILFGLIFNFVVLALAYKLSPSGKIWAAIFSFCYFGLCGLDYTKPAHKRIPFLFGGRLPEKWRNIIFKEGPSWLPPWPIMSSAERDTRERKRNFPLIEELSKDEVPVKVEIAAQTQISDVYISFNVDDPDASLQELAENVVRETIRSGSARSMPGKKKDLNETMETAIENVSEPEWGLGVKKIWVKSVRLPKEMEDELTKKVVEKIQKQNQKTAAETLRDNMEIVETKKDGTKRNITDSKLLQAAQLLDNQAEYIIVDGSAGDFTKGAALNRNGSNQQKKSTGARRFNK